MGEASAQAINDLDEGAFQSLYGRWNPLEPAAVGELLSTSAAQWWIVGGRAVRAGAPRRHHADTDIAVRLEDLDELRSALAAWHLWEAHHGTLRPLLPGDTLAEGREQLWARRDARQPWQLDIQLDRSADEWVFKRDARIRAPWPRALHAIDGIPYLRPELALLHKAHLDRPKDRADLAVAQLDPAARVWLAATLEQLGHHSWAHLVQAGRAPELRPDGR
jgi:hypothetical protein